MDMEIHRFQAERVVETTLQVAQQAPFAFYRRGIK